MNIIVVWGSLKIVTKYRGKNEIILKKKIDATIENKLNLEKSVW